jgi:tripartite-type tricarboxylate transporter receptor subunit TctC
MAGELFASVTGIKIAHIAYRGEAPAINDLLGGQFQMMFPNLSAVIGNVKAGSLRALPSPAYSGLLGHRRFPQ